MTVVCYWLYTVYYSIYNTCHCSDLTHVSIGPYMGQVPPSSLSLGALSVTITFCQSLLVTLTAVIFTFTTLCFTSTGWNHRSQSPLFALWPLTYQCGDSTSHWCPRSPGSQSRVTSIRQLWLLISCVMSLGKCPRLCVCVCVWKTMLKLKPYYQWPALLSSLHFGCCAATIQLTKYGLLFHISTTFAIVLVWPCRAVTISQIAFETLKATREDKIVLVLVGSAVKVS